MKNYTNANTCSPKQFNAALKDVFGSIASRNDQVQQLLILAVNEASKDIGGQVSNNLNWLTMLLSQAEQTRGINLLKIVKYVKEVLCANTVTWNSDKSKLTKVKDKSIKLTYCVEPTVEWFNYGKKETLAKAFDYGKRVTSAINNALDETKGGLTKLDVIKSVMGAGFSGQDIIDLMGEIATQDEAQAELGREIEALEQLVAA